MEDLFSTKDTITILQTVGHNPWMHKQTDTPIMVHVQGWPEGRSNRAPLSFRCNMTCQTCSLFNIWDFSLLVVTSIVTSKLNMEFRFFESPLETKLSSRNQVVVIAGEGNNFWLEL